MKQKMKMQKKNIKKDDKIRRKYENIIYNNKFIKK